MSIKQRNGSPSTVAHVYLNGNELKICTESEDFRFDVGPKFSSESFRAGHRSVSSGRLLRNYKIPFLAGDLVNPNGFPLMLTPDE